MAMASLHHHHSHNDNAASSSLAPISPFDVTNDVRCTDGSTCKYTCCRTFLGTYGCCNFVNAVCCSDGIHCCPEGYICQNTAVHVLAGPHYRSVQCQKAPSSSNDNIEGNNNKKIKSKKHDVKKAIVHTRVEEDDELIASSRITASSPAEEYVDSTIVSSLQVDSYSHGLKHAFTTCPDGSYCPGTTTCCMSVLGLYGCCAHTNAVCCDDHIHCCPHGTQCDTTMSRCTNSFNRNYYEFALPMIDSLSAEEVKILLHL